jgi:hypothetical protein
MRFSSQVELATNFSGFADAGRARRLAGTLPYLPSRATVISICECGHDSKKGIEKRRECSH